MQNGSKPMGDQFSYPKAFSEITGLDSNDLMRTKPADSSTDRGIMMLALRCLYHGVLMTDDEQQILRDAYTRTGSI